MSKPVVYIATIVYSEGFNDGRRSYTEVFTDKEEAIKYLYDAYCEEFYFQKEEDNLDDCRKVSERSFRAAIKRGERLVGPVIMYDGYVQFEFYEAELH